MNETAENKQNAYFGDALKAGVRQIRRIFIFIIGMTVLLIGIAMFVTPGPAIVVIPVGLGILAIEFAWARLLLRRFRRKARQLSNGVVEKFRKKE